MFALKIKLTHPGDSRRRAGAWYSVIVSSDALIATRHGSAGQNGTAGTIPTNGDVLSAIRVAKVRCDEKTSPNKGYQFESAWLLEVSPGVTLDQLSGDRHDTAKVKVIDMPGEATMWDVFRSCSNLTAPAPAPASTVAAPVATRGAALTTNGKAVRPNGETYRIRDLGGQPDVEVVRCLRASGIPVLFRGKPGCGKSALAEASYCTLNTDGSITADFMYFQGDGDVTVASLVGSDRPMPDGTWKWFDGPLTRAMRTGSGFLFDEITRTPSEVLAVLYSVMDRKPGLLRLGDRPDAELITAAPRFHIVATLNPDSMTAAPLDEALTSRFSVSIDVSTDYDAARAIGVPAPFVTIAENLTLKDSDDRAAGGEGVWAPQMRELLAVKALIDAGLGEQFAAASMIGKCDRPENVAVVADVTKRTLGYTVTPLALGGQI